MTVHFFSALFCEAKPIIKHYDLSKLENLNTFSIYSSNEGDITLTITGIGKNNAIKALDSGCNLILHCNGNIKEMRKLVKIIPTIDKFTQKKTSHFYKFLG